ncbi:13985_t:CDS:2, partial [Funneliformis geosporum]
PALDVLHQSSFQENYKVYRPVSYLENKDQCQGIQQIDNRFEINSDSNAGWAIRGQKKTQKYYVIIYSQTLAIHRKPTRQVEVSYHT